MKENHYYVQFLTEQIFLVRESLSANGEPGPDDPIVRSFDVRHDAYSYASSMNDGQNKPANTTPPETRAHVER